jgi:multisubunit Na+/H+ antiporter MnhC subunit
MAKKQKIGYQPTGAAYTRDIDAWFIFLMLAIFFPIGLYLMWTRTSWKLWIKASVTALIVILFLSRIVAIMKTPSDTTDETTANTESYTTVASAIPPQTTEYACF